jgi:ketosteroid isomerase-like protein
MDPGTAMERVTAMDPGTAMERVTAMDPGTAREPLEPLEAMARLAATWFPDAMHDPRTAQSWEELLDDAVVLREPESLPHGGRHEGLAAFRSVQAGMRQLWDQRIEGAEYWQCAEDQVVLRIVIRWTARATGRSVELPMIDLIRFRGGRIVDIEVFVQDTKSLLDTLE